MRVDDEQREQQVVHLLMSVINHNQSAQGHNLRLWMISCLRECNIVRSSVNPSTLERLIRFVRYCTSHLCVVASPNTYLTATVATTKLLASLVHNSHLWSFTTRSVKRSKSKIFGALLASLSTFLTILGEFAGCEGSGRARSRVSWWRCSSWHRRVQSTCTRCIWCFCKLNRNFEPLWCSFCNN